MRGGVGFFLGVGTLFRQVFIKKLSNAKNQGGRILNKGTNFKKRHFQIWEQVRQEPSFIQNRPTPQEAEKGGGYQNLHLGKSTNTKKTPV